MHLMLDIETLSTHSDAAVVAIGCAAFDTDGTVRSYGWRARPDEWHGHIDPLTVKWWMTQSAEARHATFDGNASGALVAAQLSELLAAYAPTQVWANDLSFDIAILRNWWSRVAATPFPISYKTEQSCRTLYALAKRYGIDYSAAYANAVAHDALSDAYCQARAVILIHTALDNLAGRLA